MSDMMFAQAGNAKEYEAIADQILADIRLLTEKTHSDRGEIERLRMETRKMAEASARLAHDNRAVLARLKAMF